MASCDNAGLQLPDLAIDVFEALSPYLNCFSQGRLIQTGCSILGYKIRLATKSFTYDGTVNLRRSRKAAWPTMIDQFPNLYQLSICVFSQEIFSPFRFSHDHIQSIPQSVRRLTLCLQNLPYSDPEPQPNYAGDWFIDSHKGYSPDYHSSFGAVEGWMTLDLSELCARPNLQTLRISGWSQTCYEYRVIIPKEVPLWQNHPLQALCIWRAWLNFDQFNALPQSLTKLKCGLLDKCNNQTVEFPPHLSDLALVVNNVALVDKLPPGLLRLHIEQKRWDHDFDTEKVQNAFWSTPLPPHLIWLRINVDHYSKLPITNIPPSVIHFQYDGSTYSKELFEQFLNLHDSDLNPQSTNE